MKNNYQFDLDTVKRFFKYDYHDRGMLKWQGFYLSDHTAALKKADHHSEANEHVKAHSQQSLETIAALLSKSFSEHRLIHLQLNILDKNDRFAQNISGVVSGFNTDLVWLTGQTSPIRIQDIRHVF